MSPGELREGDALQPWTFPACFVHWRVAGQPLLLPSGQDEEGQPLYRWMVWLFDARLERGYRPFLMQVPLHPDGHVAWDVWREQAELWRGTQHGMGHSFQEVD